MLELSLGEGEAAAALSVLMLPGGDEDNVEYGEDDEDGNEEDDEEDDDLCCDLKTVCCRNAAIGVSAMRKHLTSPDKFNISVLSGERVR